jgi:hypothetical protein
MPGRLHVHFLMFIFLLLTGTLFAQEICNPIDIMTSPTKKFSTQSGSQYCATYATIIWKDGETSGTRRIDYGTSTSYGKSATLTGSNGTATLSGLTPNTAYYWRVYRYYQGETVTTPAGSFTTTGGVSVNKFQIGSAHMLTLMIGKNPISLPFIEKNTLTLSIISLDGSVIMNKILPISGSDIKLNFNKSGTFICKVASKSGEVFKKIVLQ